MSSTLSDPHRLPTAVIPEHYSVKLIPDLENETFSGRVTITATATTSADEIVLNSDDLMIGAATVNGIAVDTSLDTEHERLTLAISVSPGPVVIEIEFSGSFNDQLVGFYISRFDDADGKPRKLATTQFEATHARKAFPCWDEPLHKAVFELEIDAPPGTDAIANTSETTRTENADGSQTITFAPTIKMSTYLVAFVIGPLEMTPPVDVDGVALRVVSVPGKADLTRFALECGVFALRYFTDYFGIPYPGDKCDLVAIPDFAFGAMENLGCITFREVLLLIDANTATQPELQRAADVINHELAHMWFGDLVTMKWWNGLWLNEAFATFMEMRCTDAFRPEWQRWVDFSTSRTAAFKTDALSSTRPIEFDVVSPSEAEGMFDILTYEKGAAVVRMLEQHLGEDEFRSGIRRYMVEHAYGNAETTDLWDAIEAETGEPVRRIMDSWIFQGGFPLVSVKVDGATATLTQSRYSMLGASDSEDQTWSVPVRLRFQYPGHEPQTVRVLLEDSETTVQLEQHPDWLVANAEGASFIRVAYSAAHLEHLANIALDVLQPEERYALIDDAWAAVLSGDMTANQFMVLNETATAETDRSVWQRIIGGFASLERLLSGDALDEYRAIVHDAISPALANLGLAPADDLEHLEDDRTRQLRGDLIRAMGTIAADREIQDEAKRTVAEGRRNPELVDPAVLSGAVDVAASVGEAVDFADYVETMKAATSPQAESRYLNSLADFPDEEQHAELQRMILEGEIRSQNAPMVIRRALANRAQGRFTWDFITTNWDHLNEAFPTSMIVRMVESIDTMSHPGDVERVAAFFADHPIEQGAKTLSQHLEFQRVASALREREAERLAQALGE